MNRVTNKLDQANIEILRCKYDQGGRLTNRWSAAKGDTKYKYDSVGNLTNIDYPTSPDISFGYDAVNRLTNMIDAVGTTLFTYTDSGQLLTEDGPFASDSLTNLYSNRLRTRLTLGQPTGLWTNAFGYDSANRLNSVASPAGTFTYTYEEPSTRLTYVNLPSGAYIYNQFDSMSRLTYTYLFSSNNVALDGYLYNYDRENQRTNEVRADSSTVAYSYDNIGQLRIANSSVNSEDRGYTYDPAWNLNYRTNNGSLSTFIVDNKNELTNAFSIPNTYDSNGNLTASAGKQYVYDDENQLIQWFSYQLGSTSPTNGDLRTDFVYDGLGRLRERLEYVLSCPATNGGDGGDLDSLAGGAQTDTIGNNCNWFLTNEVAYVYDGMRVIQERDSNNVPTCAYTRGNDLSMSLEGAGGIGGLLSRTRYFAGSPTASHMYFSDGNGNVTYMLATNQTMIASYRYDPYGNIISKSGSFADVNVYRLSSKEVHVNSGMYYYGFRFYDPNLQRWINRDPIGEMGGANNYRPVLNSPSQWVDRFGLEVQFAIGASGTAGGFGYPFAPGPFVGGQTVFGFTSSGSMFVQFQGSGMVGPGYFFGVGPILGIGHSKEPMPSGYSCSDSLHAEVNVGIGESVGGSADFNSEEQTGNFPVPKLKGGDAGIGIMGGVGASRTVTLATPAIGKMVKDLLDSIANLFPHAAGYLNPFRGGPGTADTDTDADFPGSDCTP